MISKPVQVQRIKNTKTEGDEVEKVPQDVILIAQQIKIARSLASNDLRVRAKQLKKMKRWLNIRANSSFPFSDDDFLRVWKGLFYCMWMSDKPLVQESLAEDLGSLLQCFSNPETNAQFFGAFIKTMYLEWFGIDQWRIDKFLMLVRRMLRHIFQVLKDAKWKKKYLIAFNKQIKSTVLSNNEASGLTMHIIDIYLEELAKVADGDISDVSVTILVKPFVRFMAKQDEHKMLAHVRRNIFYHLMWQSDLGQEFSDKFNAWRQMGFPTADINDLEKVEEMGEEEKEDDEETSNAEEETETTSEKHLDPRAGCVDVVIPELPLNVEPLIKEFEKLQYDDITNTKSRKCMREIIEKFKIYQTGEFPLGVKKVPHADSNPIKSMIDAKVEELDEFEGELFSTSRKLKQLNKKKRKRILQSIDLNSGEVNEDNFDEIVAKAIPTKKPKLSSDKQLKKTWTKDDANVSFQKKTKHSIKVTKEGLDKKQKNVNASLINENGIRVKKKKQKQLKLLVTESKAKITGNKINGFAETSFEEVDASTEPCLQFKQKNLKSKQNKKRKLTLEGPNDNQKLVEPPIVTRANENLNAMDKSKKKLKHTKPTQDNIKTNQTKSEWDTPLKEGETEYFVPSRKLQVKKANESIQDNVENTLKQSNLVLNPYAKSKIEKKLAKTQLLGKGVKKAQRLKNIQSLHTPGVSKKKRVKIVLQKNSAQKPSEYIKQVLSSPQLPFDAEKKPTKSLLKPNLMPSPINPFYKKKIGLKLKQ